MEWRELERADDKMGQLLGSEAKAASLGRPEQASKQVSVNKLQTCDKYARTMDWGKSCLSQIPFHPEPQNVILFGNRVFADVIC